MQLGMLTISPPTGICCKSVLCLLSPTEVTEEVQNTVCYLPLATLDSDWRVCGVIRHQSFLENTGISTG